MDLKSMLNDNAGQLPRLHTSQSSSDARTDHTPTGSSEVGYSRPTSYGPPLQTVDARTSSSGSYFAHSPHPYSAHSGSAHGSTPSAGPFSALTRSPSHHLAQQANRDSLPPIQAHNIPSISPSHSLHYQTNNQHPLPPVGTHQDHFRSPPPIADGTALPYAKPKSPVSTYQSPLPQTPYPQPPPLTYPSQLTSPYPAGLDTQGTEYPQRASGSAHTPIRQYSPSARQHYQQQLAQIQLPLQHQRARSESQSISPKTIPKRIQPQSSVQSESAASPLRSLAESQREAQARSDGKHNPQVTIDHLPQAIGEKVLVPAPFEAKLKSPAQQAARQIRQAGVKMLSSSPVPQQSVLPDSVTTSSPIQIRSIHSPVPPDSSRAMNPPAKRLASASPVHLSKRQKKASDVPPWSLPKYRPRPLNLIRDRYLGKPSTQPRPSRSNGAHVMPAPATIPTTTLPARTASKPTLQREGSILPQEIQAIPWEANIADIEPNDTIPKHVCDRIASSILNQQLPYDAVFEIEAKVGLIQQNGTRIHLPASTETVLDEEYMRSHCRFESNALTTLSHSYLNKFLNHTLEVNNRLIEDGQNKHKLFYSHKYDYDIFFELSPSGRDTLDPILLDWIKRTRTRRVRVRRTYECEAKKLPGQPAVITRTQRLREQIIKLRVADINVHDPETHFDYRISVNIESKWNGNEADLLPSPDSEARTKDRVTYRHMMYQIDLTQVSYEGGKKPPSHELEIEVSTEYLQNEMTTMKERPQESQYYRVIKTLVDNVRLLIREGSKS